MPESCGVSCRYAEVMRGELAAAEAAALAAGNVARMEVSAAEEAARVVVSQLEEQAAALRMEQRVELEKVMADAVAQVEAKVGARGAPGTSPSLSQRLNPSKRDLSAWRPEPSLSIPKPKPQIGSYTLNPNSQILTPRSQSLTPALCPKP